MGNLTQKEIVRRRIEEVGYADNFWAIENHILRLGAVIYELIRDGMRFDPKYGKTLGKERALWKNFYYIEKKNPVQEKLF